MDRSHRARSADGIHDLCLRLGEAGEEVRYCHEAVVTHMESASRGRRDRFQRSVDLYRERWRDRARRDDVSIYVEDGMLEFEYADSYPLRLSVSPRLASVTAASHSACAWSATCNLLKISVM